jgi:hypothetical protein
MKIFLACVTHALQCEEGHHIMVARATSLSSNDGHP